MSEDMRLVQVTEEQAQSRILVVEDHQDVRVALTELLRTEGFDAQSEPNAYRALSHIRAWHPALVLTDLRLPGMDGVELVKRILELDDTIDCIVMTAYAEFESAVEAIKAGATEYLRKPVDFDRLFQLVRARLRQVRIRRRLREDPQGSIKSHGVIGSSEALVHVLKLADRVAESRATVLLTGESGTGKELIVQRIHARSPRADGPLVAVNCASLTDSLVESELFGHERGAFTGAHAKHVGRFEEAHGGTLLLDEIGEISPRLQTKLLRVLQERQIRRVGGKGAIEVDVRIIAATNVDLHAAVERGEFREDLYYRLNVVDIRVPPLRDRKGDIPELIMYFVSHFSRENGCEVKGISADVMAAFLDYDWPGNVRELQNAVERAVVLNRSGRLQFEHLPTGLQKAVGRKPPVGEPKVPGATMAELERFAILRTYESTGGNTSETAKLLGISVRKVQYRLKSYQE